MVAHICCLSVDWVKSHVKQIRVGLKQCSWSTVCQKKVWDESTLPWVSWSQRTHFDSTVHFIFVCSAHETLINWRLSNVYNGICNKVLTVSGVTVNPVKHTGRQSLPHAIMPMQVGPWHRTSTDTTNKYVCIMARWETSKSTFARGSFLLTIKQLQHFKQMQPRSQFHDTCRFAMRFGSWAKQTKHTQLLYSSVTCFTELLPLPRIPLSRSPPTPQTPIACVPISWKSRCANATLSWYTPNTTYTSTVWQWWFIWVSYEANYLYYT